MANEYGIGTWGQNAWNENSDVNISVTGLQLNSSLGDETITTEINTGWGRLTWGAQDWQFLLLRLLHLLQVMD